jgi:hydroxymethylglutaryl-CoA synthase
MYTPSLYSCLVSYLLSKPLEDLVNSRVCLFSYGSGSAAAMFSLTINNAESPASRFNLDRIVTTLDARKKHMLETRVEIEPALYDSYLKNREVNNKKVPRETSSTTKSLLPGSWYLMSIDAQYRRQYERKSPNDLYDHNSAKEIVTEELSKLS